MISRAAMSSTLSMLLCSVALLAAGCDKGPKAGAANAASVSAAPTAVPVAEGAAGATAPAPAPSGKVDGTAYGAGVQLAASTPIDTILADPAAYNGKPVRVEGLITDVCPKRGCWMELAGTAPGQKLRFKVTDGQIVFPLDAKGKYALAEGVLAVRELSIEETRANAEYQAKEYGIAYDPASITKPSSLVRIDGTGAVLRDQQSSAK